MADLNDLVIFARVVEAASFSEAARRLNTPVSTVSRRIAELEEALGVRLLERSTRSLRLTDIGAEILQHAQRGVELNEAVESVISNALSDVTGVLRLSSPPSLSETVLVPLIRSFQSAYPKVRVQVFVTQRMVDAIADGVDLMLRVGELPDTSLIARRVLRYRHRLVASPTYLAQVAPPLHPTDLLDHRLCAFALGATERHWRFVQEGNKETFALSFAPHLAMNDYGGLAEALLDSGGIGDLPPLVRPELLASGRLVEVMPDWRFTAQDLSLVQPSSRQTSRPVRLFKDFAVQILPALFPELPT